MGLTPSLVSELICTNDWARGTEEERYAEVLQRVSEWAELDERSLRILVAE